MSKIENYRRILRSTPDWDNYLRQESRLPGPRANIELAKAVAEEGDQGTFIRYLRFDHTSAPANSPDEFLAFCGVLGMGKLLSKGRLEFLPTLRSCANDPRWRIREAVAMALQSLGEKDMDRLIQEMEAWCQGNWLEKRAAAAALCAPNLLQDKKHAKNVLRILDNLTIALMGAEDRRKDEYKTFRKGLGYCWSVAVVAYPHEGMPIMEHWFSTQDPDVRWVMRENLKKKRLARIDPNWVNRSRLQVDISPES
jgi:hypothetical protein